MLLLCDQLHNFTTTNPITQQIKRPFHTSLSRIFIVITTTNGNDIAYENRKKSMALALERIGKKMLRANKRLGEQKMSEQKITAFISLLSAHAAMEPLVKTAIIKKVVLATILIAITSYIAYQLFFNKDSIIYLKNWFEPIKKDFVGAVAEEVSDRLLKGATKNEAQIQAAVQRLTVTAGSGLISGALTGQSNQAAAATPGAMPAARPAPSTTPAATTAPPGLPTVPPAPATAINPAVQPLLDNLHHRTDAIVDHAQQQLGVTINNALDNVHNRTNAVVDHAQQRLDAAINNALDNAHNRTNAVVDHARQRLDTTINNALDNAHNKTNAVVDHAQQRLDATINNALDNAQARAHNVRLLGWLFIPPTAAQRQAEEQDAAREEQQYREARAHGDFRCGTWNPWRWNWLGWRWEPWNWFCVDVGDVGDWGF